MEYEEFEKKLLSFLKNNNIECLNLIDDNEKLIQLKLQNNENPVYIKRLINNLNDIILQLQQFNLIEKILNHNLLPDVLIEFQQSDILIRACKMEKIEAINWLLTMNINKSIQDKNGMTALMHAVEHSNLFSVVKVLVEEDNESIYIKDNKNETILFHAVHNLEILKYLIYNTKLDVNQLNCNNESIFLFSCKRDIEEAVDALMVKTNLNPNLMDNDGKTGPMYLVENGRYKLINLIIKIYKQFDINLRNKKNEGFLASVLKKYCYYYTSENFLNELNNFKKHCYLLMYLCTLNCDFNYPIDEYGNTPIMFFLLIKDYSSALYILKKVENIDLSIKNCHGISASYLTFFIDNDKKLTRLLLKHKTFDHSVIDKYNNNLLIHCIIKKNFNEYFNILANNLMTNEEIFNKVNDQKENFIIVATKLSCLYIIDNKFMEKANINQQDYLGNTAIYYAVKINDKYGINKLIYYQADPTIKNNDGTSALDLAIEMKEEDIINILNRTTFDPKNWEKKFNSNKNLISKVLQKCSSKKKTEVFITNSQIMDYQKSYDYMLVPTDASYTPPKNVEINCRKIFSTYFPVKITKKGASFVLIENLDNFDLVIDYIQLVVNLVSS